MECTELKAAIVNWFGEELECHGRANSFTTVLPLLKPNGDSIELGIRVLDDSSWRISDLGHTRETLYLGGVDLNEESDRSDEFQRLVSNQGLTDRDDELSCVVSRGDIPGDLFNFVSALQSLLALQFTIKTKQPTRDFASIVAKFLAEQRASFEIPIEPVEGLTGSWKFNFELNRVAPATFVKTLTATSTTQAMRSTEQSVFEIRDVREVQPKCRTAVILDDEGQRDSLWKPRMKRVFGGYHIPVMGFIAQREQLLELAREYRR